MQHENNIYDWIPKDDTHRGKGYIVQTKHGKGYLYYSEKLVNGKAPIVLEDGSKILCSRENLTIIGFVD